MELAALFVVVPALVLAILRLYYRPPSLKNRTVSEAVHLSDATTIGSGCTLGVATMVHYGVTMGDGVVLAPDSFLMKGSEVPAHERWGGNPAEALTEPASGPPPRGHVAASPAVAPALRDGATDAVATR